MATAVGMPLGCIRCFSGMGLDLISLSGQPENYFFWSVNACQVLVRMALLLKARRCQAVLEACGGCAHSGLQAY